MSSNADYAVGTSDGDTMVTVDRWKAAQKYEHDFWQGVAEDIDSGQMPAFDWYQWRADQLRDRLIRCGLDHLAAGDCRIVEIGSGPIGLVNNFKAVERVTVDPLSDYYTSDSRLAEVRDPGVEHRQGMGEELPCATAHFDLAVIENCIDHVHDPDAVMDEIVRVLNPSGVLYLTVNSRTPWWGYWVHRLLSKLRLDPGHPHTFTPRRAQKLFARHGFEVVDVQVGSAFKAHVEDLKGPGMRARLKAILGVSEYLVSLMGRRTTGAGR